VRVGTMEQRTGMAVTEQVHEPVAFGYGRRRFVGSSSLQIANGLSMLSEETYERAHHMTIGVLKYCSGPSEFT